MTKISLVSASQLPPANAGGRKDATSGFCCPQMPEQISTTNYSGLENKMANGLGGDLSSFETDPESLAVRIAAEQAARRQRTKNGHNTTTEKDPEPTKAKDAGPPWPTLEPEA